MKIRPGIRDIRAIRKEDPKGWHIFSADAKPEEAYLGYFDENLSNLIGSWSSDRHELVAVQGNTITVQITN